MDCEDADFSGANFKGAKIDYLNITNANLKDANFDPEFYKQHEQEIADKFNAENGTSITVKKANWRNLIFKSAKA